MSLSHLMQQCRALASCQLPCGVTVLTVCCPGYRVGRQLIEKYMFNRPQLKDSLDIIRFICKEFWGDLFKKQVLLPVLLLARQEAKQVACLTSKG